MGLCFQEGLGKCNILYDTVVRVLSPTVNVMFYGEGSDEGDYRTHVGIVPTGRQRVGSTSSINLLDSDFFLLIHYYIL